MNVKQPHHDKNAQGEIPRVTKFLGFPHQLLGELLPILEAGIVFLKHMDG